MYRIYYNDLLFYNDETPVPELKVIDPYLEVEANTAGLMNFVLSPENIAYDTLQRMKGEVKVYKGDSADPIWVGRITSENMTFYKTKKFTCEGELAFLNDTMQPQHVYTGITLRQYIDALLKIHNQKADDTKKFEIGIVTVNETVTAENFGTRATNFESTWSALKKLVEDFKGYMIVRHLNGVRYLDYRSECPRRSSQAIEFGSNLMDFTKTYDLTSLATVLLPLGKKLASGGQVAIGAELNEDTTPSVRISQGYWIDTETNNICHDDTESSRNLYGSTDYFEVQADHTYYLTSRNGHGRVMYVLKDSNGEIIQRKTASSGEEFTDLIETKIEVPRSDVGNTYRLAIAGYGQDIKLRINDSIAPDENLDAFTTIESVNEGSAYVKNSDAVSTYGWIEKQITWEDIDNPTLLKTTAEKYLNEGQFDEMSLEVKAVDLQTMGINTDSIWLLDEVKVQSSPHGLDKWFPVTKLEIHLAHPQDNKFVLGEDVRQTLSGITTTSSNDIYNKIASIPPISATLKQAKDNATQLINDSLQKGMVNFVLDENGNIIAIKITKSGYDWQSPDAVGWLLSAGGIAYYPKGFNGEVSIALTGEDGGLVANAITSGYISGDRMRGGTLDLGHVPIGDSKYIDGSIRVYNSTGEDVVMEVNQNGTYFNSSHYGIENHLRIEDGWLRGRVGRSTGISLDTQHGGTDSITINAPWLELYVGAINVHSAEYPTHTDPGITGYMYIPGLNLPLQFSHGICVGFTTNPWGENMT